MGIGEQILAGWQWFGGSVRTFCREPFAFTAVAGVYVMTMGLLGMIPFVGLVFAGVFWPFGTLLIAKGGKDSLAGKKPTVAILFEAWARNDTRVRLIRIGILYSMMAVLVSLVWELLAADEIAKWQITEAGRVNWASAAEHIPYGAIAASFCVYIPCAMALWFAPLLVYLKNLPLPKAVFFSFVGCTKNLLAIALSLALAFSVTSILMALAAGLIVAGGLGAVAMFLIFPISLIGSALIYGTYYPMWKTLFSEVALETDAVPSR